MMLLSLILYLSFIFFLSILFYSKQFNVLLILDSSLYFGDLQVFFFLVYVFSFSFALFLLIKFATVIGELARVKNT